MSLLLNIEMNQRSPPKVTLATSLTRRTMWPRLMQHIYCSTDKDSTCNGM